MQVAETDKSASCRPSDGKPPLIVVITCDVISEEVAEIARGEPRVLHIEVLRQGLHNDPPLLRAELQIAVDRVEAAMPEATAIVLGYGLCSRGVEGVVTKRCTLVLPRAHDCITLLLGDKDRYAEYVAAHPGTYWYSPGWNRCHVPPGRERYDKLYKTYLEKFGEDDAKFLMETEQAWFTSYDRATYVDLGTPGATDSDVAYTQACAQWLGWKFDRQKGSRTLLRDLITGNWDDERFLVLAPGQTPQMTADQQVVTAVTLNGKEIAV